MTSIRYPITVELDLLMMTLREVRQDRGLSCVAVAREIGVTAMSLGRWEQGLRAPAHEALQAWAATLGVDIPDGVEGRPPWTPPDHGTYARAIYDRRHNVRPCAACRAVYLERQLFYSARRRRIAKTTGRIQRVATDLRELRRAATVNVEDA